MLDDLAVPGWSKLLQYLIRWSIDSIAQPTIEPWRARRNAKALLTEVQSIVDAKRLLEDAGHGVRELTAGTSDAETVRYVSDQEARERRNVISLARMALDHLGDEGVPDHKPNVDWLARFFGDGRNIHDEEIQAIWARILAGEVERPGRVSLRTLSVLRDLDRTVARTFVRYCSMSLALTYEGGIIADRRVPTLGESVGLNSLAKYGLAFDDLNLLNEHGLIIPEYQSEADYSPCIGPPLQAHMAPTIDDQMDEAQPSTFMYQSQRWILIPIGLPEKFEEFLLSGIASTRAGRELSGVVAVEMVERTLRMRCTSFS